MAILFNVNHPAPPFSPLDISGCVLWLKSDTGVTKDGLNRVSLWEDQSGNNNDASQGTDGNKPIWVDNQINAFPVLRSTRAAGTFMDLASLITGIIDCTILFVAKHDYVGAGNHSGGIIMDYTTITQCGISLAEYFGNALLFVGTNGAGGGANSYLHPFGDYSNYCIGTFKKESTNLYAYFNGSLTDTNTISASYNTVYLDALFHTLSEAGPSGSLEGDLAEIIVYNSDLSDGYREQVENYLLTKYAIS